MTLVTGKEKYREGEREKDTLPRIGEKIRKRKVKVKEKPFGSYAVERTPVAIH